jgi:hypothetical protein
MSEFVSVFKVFIILSSDFVRLFAELKTGSSIIRTSVKMEGKIQMQDFPKEELLSGTVLSLVHTVPIGPGVQNGAVYWDNLNYVSLIFPVHDSVHQLQITRAYTGTV